MELESLGTKAKDIGGRDDIKNMGGSNGSKVLKFVGKPVFPIRRSWVGPVFLCWSIGV